MPADTLSNDNVAAVCTLTDANGIASFNIVDNSDEPLYDSINSVVISVEYPSASPTDYPTHAFLGTFDGGLPDPDGTEVRAQIFIVTNNVAAIAPAGIPVHILISGID